MTDEAKALVEKLRALHVWPQVVADGYADLLTRRQIEKLYEVGHVSHEAADLIETQAREIERLRGLLREAEVKLTDVQGAYATKQYSANLLTRIRAALGETFEDLGQAFEAVWDANRDKLYEGDTK